MNTRDPAASAVKELTHFIGGKHVAGRDAKSGGRFGDVFNPTLGKLSAKAPLASKTEVEAALGEVFGALSHGINAIAPRVLPAVFRIMAVGRVVIFV